MGQDFLSATDIKPASSTFGLFAQSEAGEKNGLCRRLIDLGRVEVKTRQIPMRRKPGRMHLAAHRAHGPVGVFGLQQVCRRIWPDFTWASSHLARL